MKLVDFAVMGSIVWVLCAAHTLILIHWLKKKLPTIIKANTPPPKTLERGLLSRLEQATDGTRFYGKRY